MSSRKHAPGALLVAAALILVSLPFILPVAEAEGWVKVDLGRPFAGNGYFGLYDVAIGDGDCDNSTEIYAISSADNCVYQFSYRENYGIWLNESIGCPPGFNYYADAVAVGDGDDDGQNEVYSCAATYEDYYFANRLFEYTKTASGWEIADMGAAGEVCLGITIGDGDRDGRKEVYSADSDGHIYQYSKSGEWNRADIGFAPDYWYEDGYWVTPGFYGSVVADGDNDGKMEVYGASSDNHIYRFNYTGSGWTRDDLGASGPMGQNYYGFSGIVAGDADGDGKNELYGCGFTNGSVCRFSLNATTGSWDVKELVSTGTNGYRICMGDGDSDGNKELYISANNKQLYQVRRDAGTGKWTYDSVGAGNGPLQGIAIGSGTADTHQQEVYAACQDGHLYQFYIDRAPPSNPTVKSDTHPVPGTWYKDRSVHVLWTDTGFDISGIDGYSVSWDADWASAPDDIKEYEESVHNAWSPRLSDGVWFFHIRTRDNSLNWNRTTVTFGPIFIDGGAPYNLGLKIGNGFEYVNRSLVQLSLTASDPGGGSGVAAMSFSNDGTTWSPWEDYQGTREGWDLTAKKYGGEDSDGLKYVYARVKDLAGNEVTAKNRTSGSIILDRVAPGPLSMAINGGAQYTSSPDLSLELAGTDAEPSSGLAGMAFSNDGKNYGAWLDWADSARWSLTGGAGWSSQEGWRDVYMMARDRAWNIGGPVKASIFFDRTAPSGLGLKINKGAPFTNESAVDLVIAAEDPAPGSEVGEITLANTAGGFRDWLPFQGAVAGWNLTSETGGTDTDGNKTVYLKVRDRAGNAGGPASASIFLDRVRPASAGITINGGAQLTNQRQVSLGLSAQDPEPSSGIRSMQFSDDGTGWSAWEDFAPQKAYTLPDGDGIKTVSVQMRDAAGNIGDMASGSIRLDTAPPVLSGIRIWGVTDRSAVIGWSTDELADSAVDFGTTAGYGSSKPDPAATTAHSIALDGLEASTAYHFRVRSSDLAGNPTAVSDDHVFITGAVPDRTPPSISDVRVLGLTDRLAVIGWSTNEPADSALRWGPGLDYAATVREGSFVLLHSLTLRNLRPSTTYHFRAESTDASGNGPSASEDRTFTTLASPDTSPPVISILRVTAISDRLAVVSWETDEPSTGVLEFGTTAAYGASMADGRLLNSHELTLAPLAPSTTYHIRVSALDASGNGPAQSGDVQFTTAAGPDTTPPTITAIRVEGVTDDSAVVLWETDEPSDGLVEYGTDLSYGISSQASSYVQSHSVVLSNLNADALYHFRIRSSDPAGNVATGGDRTFRTAKTSPEPDRIPPVISGVVVAGITDARAVVMWLTDELSDGEVDYGTDRAYDQRARDPAYTTVHSVVLEGLKPSTGYHLRVSSRDVWGNGPAIGPDVDFTTATAPDRTPPVITNVRVSEITNDSAFLSWRTNEPANGLVEYGPANAMGLSASSRQFVLNHTLKISGLAARTNYSFRISSTDPSGNTAMAGNRSFSTSEKGLPPQPATPNGRPATAVGGGIPLLSIAAAASLAVAVAVALGYRRYRSRRSGLPVLEEIDMEPPMMLPPEPEAVDWGAPAGVEEPPAMTPLPPDLEDPDWAWLAKTDAGAGTQDPGALTDDAVREIAVATLMALDPKTPAPGLGEPLEVYTPSVQAGVRTARCPGCSAMMPAPVGPYPAHVQCPDCGKTGIYRGPKETARREIN